MSSAKAALPKGAAVLTPGEFRASIKRLSGGYLFCGEEDYLKRSYRRLAREELIGEENLFDWVILSEAQATPERLMAAMETLPVLNEKKLIEIAGVPFGDLPQGDLEEWRTVLSRLPDFPDSVVILSVEPEELDPGTAKQPSAAVKRLSEVVTPVLFAHETPARLAAWITKHFSAEKIICSPDTVNLLMDRCGRDMYTLSSEIDKLAWYLKSQERERLTEKDILLVSSETKEIAAFDFANAILKNRADEALSVLNEQKKRKEKPELLLGGISRVICDLLAVKVLSDAGIPSSGIASRLKMHEYKVGLYLKSAARTEAGRLERLTESCHEADRLIKSTALDRYGILERLAVEAAAR